MRTETSQREYKQVCENSNTNLLGNKLINNRIRQHEHNFFIESQTRSPIRFKNKNKVRIQTTGQEEEILTVWLHFRTTHRKWKCLRKQRKKTTVLHRWITGNEILMHTHYFASKVFKLEKSFMIIYIEMTWLDNEYSIALGLKPV